MAQACGEKVWFAFEAPGFQMAFTCRKSLGHDGEHSHSDQQRQPDTGKNVSYNITWRPEQRRGINAYTSTATNAQG